MTDSQEFPQQVCRQEADGEASLFFIQVSIFCGGWTVNMLRRNDQMASGNSEAHR
jgi:hypothetical protein